MIRGSRRPSGKGTGARDGSQHLRRDHHRGRTQRTRERRVFRPRRPAHGRPGGTEQDRRRGGYERTVRGSSGDQRHHLLLRDVADAPHEHPLAPAEGVRLRRDSLRPVLPGVSRRTRGHRLPRRIAEVLRLDRRVLEAGRGHDAEVGGMAPRRGRRARSVDAARPPARRLDASDGSAVDRPGRMEDAQARRARRRRRHAAVHDERYRSAQRLVRVRCGQGHARGERRDRDVGGSGRTGHRLCDAPSLDRGCGRRPSRLLGVPAGRDGRRQQLDPIGRRGVRMRDPHGGPREEDRRPERACRRRRARRRPGAPRPGLGQLHPPADRVPRPGRPARAPSGFRVGHRALEDAERRRQDQRRDQRAPGLQGATREGAPGPSHGLRRAVLLHGLRGAGVPRRPPVPEAVGGAVRRRNDPDDDGQEARARGDARVLDVHAVGSRRLGEGAPSGRAGRVREADLRSLRRARAELQRLDHRLPGDRAARHGAGARSDRREHLPRRALGGPALPHASGAGLRGLPDAVEGAVPRFVRDARRRRRERDPRVAGVPSSEEGPRRPHEVSPEPGERAPRTSLERMLEARSVAVVGASIKAGSLGHQMMAELRRGGFDGAVYPVNPSYEAVHGYRCYPSLLEVPEPVDLAILGLANARIEAAMADAAERGAGSVVTFSSLYEEPSDGPSLAERVAAIAATHGIAVCGGNGMGFVNVPGRPRATGFPTPDDLRPGPVTFLSHSGSAFAALAFNDRGIGFDLLVSSGQEVVTPMDEYLRFALERDSTKVVALLLETVRNPDGFRAGLAHAAERDVPVLALTVGRTDASKALVVAHSGALAGEHGAYEAVFDAYGVHEVRSLDEMADAIELFSSPRRVHAGRGIASIHDSGGERALFVDLATEHDVPIARVSDATLGRIEVLLDPGLEAANPLDAWGTGIDADRIFRESFAAFADDDAVAAMAFVVDMTRQGAPYDEGYLQVARDVWDTTSKPFCVLSNLSAAVDHEEATMLREAGIPVLEGTISGLRALKHLLDDGASRARPADPAPSPASDEVREWWRVRLATGDPIGEQEGLRLLSDYGLPAVATREARSAEEATGAAEEIGYPVALKTAAEDVHHKTDAG